MRELRWNNLKNSISFNDLLRLSISRTENDRSRRIELSRQFGLRKCNSDLIISPRLHYNYRCINIQTNILYDKIGSKTFLKNWRCKSQCHKLLTFWLLLMIGWLNRRLHRLDRTLGLSGASMSNDTCPEVNQWRESGSNPQPCD